MLGGHSLRIEEHPILTFTKGKKVTFEYEGQTIEGYEDEPIAAALHAAGIRVLGTSLRYGHPRGFFCAVGKCASCLMVVDGKPNVMACITPVRQGMVVHRQKGRGKLV